MTHEVTASEPINSKPWLIQRKSGESDEALTLRREIAYFEWQLFDNQKWRTRIGFDFPVAGKDVIELGCGHGALSLSLAQQGARTVLGIDLDSERIHFAKIIAPRYEGTYGGTVDFQDIDLNNLGDEKHYDLIVSKDTFEHIDDLPRLISKIAKLLKPGGQLVAGFSPLYYSPFGDHGRWQLKLPWLHALLPEKILAKWLSSRSGEKVKNAADLGLNKITLSQFQGMIDPSIWKTESFRVNAKESFLIKIFNILRRIPGCEKYFTVSIYAVFTKR